MKFGNALYNIKSNLELRLSKLSTNVSFVRIRTKGDPVLLMENLPTIVKRRDILTLSNKIWIIVNNCESLFVDVVEDEENSSSENEWTKIDLLVNQTLLSFKIDSGAKPILSQKIVLEP